MTMVALTPADVEKLAAYNAANRQVAILCNHQRAVPKTHDQSMEKMKAQVSSHSFAPWSADHCRKSKMCIA
jgi:DNA topoisomerase-1